MELKWILLALFLVSMVRNVAKAMRNPMLKNFLRLMSVLVAFIITFILQVCGVFQHVAAAVLERLELASMVPEYEGIIVSAIGYLLPFVTTILTPLVFTLVFVILYLLLQLIHVNLVYKYIVRRQRKKEIKELKIALREERMRMKQAITENEERFQSIMAHLAVNNPEIDVYEYEALDEDEIDKMIEHRVKLEKKRKKKVGFFKESRERKAMSVVCGVVCGFLLFGITWMGLFYSMDVLSDVTDGIKGTGAEDTKIYQIMDMVDKHVVTPYEDSFVYGLYDSMGIVDLMNNTVRMGGKIEINGETRYADDVMRTNFPLVVRLACEMTSSKSEQAHVHDDISALTKDEMMVSLLADVLVVLVDKIPEPEPDSDDAMGNLWSGILLAYKGENNRELFVQDLNAFSDIVVVAADNKLLQQVIANSSDLGSLLENRKMIKEMVGAMSGLSIYAPTMESAFTLGVDKVGVMLAPEDDAKGYENLVNALVNASKNVTKITDEDMLKFNDFMKDVSAAQNIFDYVSYPIDYVVENIKPDADALLVKIKNLTSEIKNLKNLLDTTTQTKEEQETLSEIEREYVQHEINLLKQMKEDETLTEEQIVAIDTKILKLEAILEDDVFTVEEAAVISALIAEKSEEDVRLAQEEKVLLELIYDNYLPEFENRVKSFAPFISYFINWMNVQKPFMIANEDGSTACLTVDIDGIRYMCNTDIVTIEALFDMVNNAENGSGESDVDDPFEDIPDDGEGGTDGSDNGDNKEETLKIDVDSYLNKIPMKSLLEQLTVTVVTEESPAETGKVSELTNLVNFIILSANTHKNQVDAAEIDNVWLYNALKSYCSVEECNCVSCRIRAAEGNPSTFAYKGVTVEKMKASMNFGEKWTAEHKKADSETLAEIVFTLLDLMENMNTEGSETTEGETDNSQIQSMLGLLKTLGITMDQMSTTECLQELPHQLLESILKNEKLSIAITPAMIYGENGYMSRIERGELTYAGFMEELATKVSTILEKVNNNKTNNEGGDAV